MPLNVENPPMLPPSTSTAVSKSEITSEAENFKLLGSAVI